jgi:tetratricopeptide (TPR) repeat protein
MGDNAIQTEARLHLQLEQAVRAGRARAFLLPQLERLAAIATEGSAAWRFANLQLSELLLEQAPWRAALHARRVASREPADDAAHALLGLALALQSNHRAAIAAYRAALRASPRNPWYAHNIGHLFDVALDAPREGLPLLRAAHREEPEQQDVAASLAHCLARCGHLDEARSTVDALVLRHPHRDDFLELQQWIHAGAPTPIELGAPALLASTGHPEPAPALHGPPTAHSDRSDRRGVGDESIESLLERAPLSDDQRARASLLWSDYEARARPVIGRARVLVAALEYAILRVDRAGITQREVAARYAVSQSAVRSRYSSIRSLLSTELAVGRYEPVPSRS